MNIASHTVEVKELEVHKIKVVEENVCEKPKMFNEEQEITQADSEPFLEEDADEASCTVQADAQSEVDTFNLSTMSDTVPLLEEERKSIKIESFLQDDTAEGFKDQNI
ncbi:hypothetical protein CU097_005291 [Rhizopus azygosporus]|uniref:Uncharacterized protein n=1 Tax=Rhizopus azygosporus TaxID=86630 RepID=A0A367JBD3_RHIAZ|nr:hypothetical protein CU097_005291 [Rhizopus azygosporus]